MLDIQQSLKGRVYILSAGSQATLCTSADQAVRQGKQAMILEPCKNIIQRTTIIDWYSLIPQH